MEIETFYIIVRGKDGSLTTWTEMPEEAFVADRIATQQDMYDTSAQIVRELDKADLVGRLAQMTAAILKDVLTPTEAKVSDTIKDALKERGIEPESVTPTE